MMGRSERFGYSSAFGAFLCEEGQGRAILDRTEEAERVMTKNHICGR
jgi:hypothetical protein